MQTARSKGATPILSSLTDIKRDFQRGWVLSVNSAIGPYKTLDFFSLGKGIISSDLLHPGQSGYVTMGNLASTVLLGTGQSLRPADTDADGMYDFAETRIGSNPMVADTDGDSLKDGDEVFVYGSSPTNVNTDGDQFSDEFEVKTLGSNPGDPRPGAPRIDSLEVVNP